MLNHWVTNNAPPNYKHAEKTLLLKPLLGHDNGYTITMRVDYTWLKVALFIAIDNDQACSQIHNDYVTLKALCCDIRAIFSKLVSHVT